jgi:hypothetical protein
MTTKATSSERFESVGPLESIEGRHKVSGKSLLVTLI